MASHSLKTIGTNTLSQLAIKLLSSTSTLAATILISRFLGFEAFGSFTKIVTFISFFYLLADFGINTIFLKEFKDKLEAEFGNIVFLRILLGVFLASVAVGIAFLLPYSPLTHTGYSSLEKFGILLYSVTIISTALSFSLTVYFQKKLRYHSTIFPNVIATLVFFVFLFWGIQTASLYLILIGYVASSFMLCLLLYKSLRSRYGITTKLNNVNHFSKSILLSSAPLGAMLALNLVYAKADTVLLSFLKPTADVGVYGFAYRIFEFLIAVPAFFSNAVYPILLESHANEVLFMSLIKKYSFILFLLAVILGCAMYFASPLIVMLSPHFAAAVDPLKTLCLSLPFFFLTSLFQWVLVIKNKKMLLLGIYGASMIVNIILNLMFIPQYSFHASATITVITEGFVFLSMTIYLGLRRVKISRKP